MKYLKTYNESSMNKGNDDIINDIKSKLDSGKLDRNSLIELNFELDRLIGNREYDKLDIDVLNDILDDVRDLGYNTLISEGDIFHDTIVIIKKYVNNELTSFNVSEIEDYIFRILDVFDSKRIDLFSFNSDEQISGNNSLRVKKELKSLLNKDRSLSTRMIYIYLR